MMVFGDSVDANEILDICAEAAGHGIPVSLLSVARRSKRPASQLGQQPQSRVNTGFLGCPYCKCNQAHMGNRIVTLVQSIHTDPPALSSYLGCSLKKRLEPPVWFRA